MDNPYRTLTPAAVAALKRRFTQYGLTSRVSDQLLAQYAPLALDQSVLFGQPAAPAEPAGPEAAWAASYGSTAAAPGSTGFGGGDFGGGDFGAPSPGAIAAAGLQQTSDTAVHASRLPSGYGLGRAEALGMDTVNLFPREQWRLANLREKVAAVAVGAGNPAAPLHGPIQALEGVGRRPRAALVGLGRLMFGNHP